MNNYAPLFSHVVDSSLWDEEAHVTKVFLTMLALKDWDHVVRWSAHHLSNKAKVGDALFLKAIKVLESPDKKSKIPQEFEGRRIKKVEDGWLILNGEKYQQEMKRANDRARWARNKREQRARMEARSTPAPGETAYVKAYGDGADEKTLSGIVDQQKQQNL
jgi:hypothetical protein